MISTPKPVWHRQIRWKLTLSYSLVIFFVVIIVETLVVTVPLLFAHYLNDDIMSVEVVQEKIRIVLRDDLLAIPIILFLGHMISSRFSARIELMIKAADAWAQGLFNHRLSDDSEDEIGILTRKLQRMSEQLQNTVETEQALAAARERDRMARDLHDTVKQQAFAIQMELSAVRNVLTSDPEAAATMLDDAITHTRQARADLNTLITQLPPAGLANKTLGAALREYVERIDMMGVALTLNITGDREMPVKIEEAFFRMAQGALSNVAKHSQATTAAIEYRHDGHSAVLRVVDDGNGFDPKEPGIRSFGLESMRTRMDEIGGSLVIESAMETGTTVTAHLARLEWEEES